MSPWIQSRRAFLRASAVAAGAVVLGGCGDGTGLDPALDNVTPAAAGEPSRGGVLRYGLSTDPSNFEPHVTSGAAADVVCQLCYNGLLAYDDEGEIVGDLAAEHGWVDERTYQVRLHPEVYFHDGSRMTTSDVVFSFRRMLDPATAASAGPLLDGLEEVRATGRDTVLFRLREPNAALPSALASPSANVVSEAWINSGVDPKTTMMGTGPFRFEERIPGVSLTFRRFDNYFVPELPYLNAIQFVPMEDDYARVTALRSATVDMIDYVPATHFGVIQSNPKLRLVSDNTFGFGWVGFVTSKPPFDDVRVRKAVALALDRQSILDTAFLGNGETMTGSLISPEIASYPRRLAGTVEHDPDQAKFLLRKAGRRNLTLPVVTTSSYSVISRPAEAMLPGLRAAGIDVQLVRQEWLSFRETVSAKTFPVHSWGSAPSYGDPDALRDFVGTGGSFATNLDFSDERVDSLLAQARRATDDGLREELYYELEKRVLDLMPMTYTVRREQGEAHHDYVRGFRHPPKGAWTQTSLRRTWLER
ncbi:peptide/nickel transport system substrate-binding protein [Tamaricihabitans halophyticus]|uniref:Peptide/nickel transport system substrate-binding protein n=1 Tax=Tamaricihabitans halophyticus TaxID=1262583 RepID=A0A4R2QVV3_9PSEU|nr:ABC transporter substrate-binding protein [Tamaricihabitans halophyticus]TCP53018.1 peptide/nickel transport system substrate-binding protein [Tamaricihabitans halophyticus]